MEKFRQSIAKDLIFFGIYSALVLIFVIFGIVAIKEEFSWVNGDMVSFDMGVCVGLELVMIYYVGKYLAALNDEKKLKKLYIEETDERTQFIRTKVGGKSTIVIILSLLLAGLAAGYFNFTVFVTLIAATVFSSLVQVVLKIYYNSKY